MFVEMIVAVKWMMIKFQSHVQKPDCQFMIKLTAEFCHQHYTQTYTDHILETDDIHADALSLYLPVSLENPSFNCDTKTDATTAFFESTD